MPGGVVPEASDAALRRLADRAPAISAQDFQRAFGTYVIERDHVELAVSDHAKHLAQVARLSRKLADALTLLDNQTRDYVAEARARLGDAGLSERLKADCFRMAATAEAALKVARQDVRKGAPAGARRQLILRLNAALRKSGVEADARPSGQLVRAVALAIEEAGDARNSERIDTLVRQVLKNENNRRKNSD